MSTDQDVLPTPEKRQASEVLPEQEDSNKRSRLDNNDASSTSPSTAGTPATASPPVTSQQQQPDVQVQTDSWGSSSTLTLHNGIRIPKDSALLSTVELPQKMDLSPLSLMKANLASLPLTLTAHDSLPIRVQFSINSIPLLDNVATQILRLIGVGPYEETLAIITNEEPTPEGLVYKELVELFEQVRRIYSDEDPFLDLKHIVEDTSMLAVEGVENLKTIEDGVDSALRKANLATFLLATLGSIDVGFFYLDESFLDVFCPSTLSSWFKITKPGTAQYNVTAGKLLKAHAGLFLELKTQAFISALESGDRSKDEILDDIFPESLEQTLLERRHSTQLTPAEQEFIMRCKSRRETLLNTSDEQDLSENYDWLIFLKELFSYVSKNIGSLLWGRKGRNTFLAKFSDVALVGDTVTPLSSLSKEEIQKRLQQKQKEWDERERRLLAEDASRKAAAGGSQPQPDPNASLPGSSSSTAPTATTTNTSSTGVLTTATAPPRLRNIMRRPWTSDEEAALVEALKTHGPHWAKILEFYGPGGKQSEALKSRTQVQLKDKARNWKMSYLKNGNPVPPHLQKVTGELDRDEKVANARRKQRQKNSLQKQGSRPLTKSVAAEAAAKAVQKTNETEKEKAKEPEPVAVS